MFCCTPVLVPYFFFFSLFSLPFFSICSFLTFPLCLYHPHPQLSDTQTQQKPHTVCATVLLRSTPTRSVSYQVKQAAHLNPSESVCVYVCGGRRVLAAKDSQQCGP